MEKKIHIIDDPNKMAAFVFSHAGNDDEAVLLALEMDEINKDNVKRYVSMTGDELEALPENESAAIKADGERYIKLYNQINNMHVVAEEYFKKYPVEI